MNYNDVYVKKLIKLYEKYIDAIPFGKNQINSDQLKRILEILHSILNFTLKGYLNDYDKILTRYTYDLDEELKKLQDLLVVIEQRDSFVNKYINMYEKRVLEKVTDDISEFVVSSKMEPIKRKIDLINQYNSNVKRIDSLAKKNAENKLEITRLNDLMNEYRNDNVRMGEEFNKAINKLLIEYGIYNIDKEDVDEYYPKYQELYFKAKEQRENRSFDLSDVYDLAIENYNIYNFKYQLLALSSAMSLGHDSYDSYSSKLDKISDIIDHIANHPIYNRINNILKCENEKLLKQKVSIDRLEYINDVVKKNNVLMEKLREENNGDEIRKITNQFIVDSKLFNEEQSVEGKALKDLPIEKVTYNKDNIIKVDSSPEWLISEISKNKSKFMNWFKKVNNLVFGEN